MNLNRSFLYMAKAMLILALLIGSYSASAQKTKINFNHLTVENGLSQSSVLSIAQDSMGFMWFGTKDGLNRFNTQTFEVYKHDKNNPTSLSSSQNINALLTDRKGNLWVGTQNGLNLYLPESNSFKHFLNDPKDKSSISHNVIRSLYQDRQGNIWVGTENGLNKLLKNNKFEHYYAAKSAEKNVAGSEKSLLNARKGLADGEKGLADGVIKAIFQDHQNTIWLGTADGLSSMKPENGKYTIQSFVHDPNNPGSLVDNDVTAIYEDRYQNLWIGTHNHGMELMDREKQTFRHFTAKKGKQDGLSSNIIRKIKMDTEGKLWISTINGLNIFDLNTQKFTAYNHNPDDPSSLNQNSIYDILQDQAGSMWVGSYYGGVNVYHANSTPFRKYKANLEQNGISSNVVSMVTEDARHNLWIGTEAEGLNYYNRANGTFTNFKSEPDNPNSLSSNLVKAISIDRKGQVWVGTYEGGLDVYLPESGKFKHYKPNSVDQALHGNRIVYLRHDSRGRLWVGTRSHGIYQYQEDTDRLVQFTDPVYKDELKFVRYFFEDSQQNIWIATNSGTYILAKNGKSLQKFQVSGSDITFDDLSFIQEDSNKNIWLGSYDSGLIKYNPVSKKLQVYTVADGLPANHAVGLLEDAAGGLWISTSNGLSNYNHKTFTNYTVVDGLTGNVFNYNSFFKDSKGELFFGGYNGLISFFPEQIKRNTKIPKAVFTQLKLFNKPVDINDGTKLLNKDVSLTKEITFSAHQNIFTIDFAILSYIKSEKNKYAYKLDGFEKEWNYVNSPSVTFTNLPPGKYTLLIMGANNDGVWTENPEELIVYVNPPFWKTWWAYLIYLVCLSGLVFLVFRFLWIRALLRKENEIFQMKLDFFTNVSHEIRTPLTLIVGPLEQLVQETQESPALNRKLLTVKRNAGRLTRLVNELMDFRKAEAGKMKLNVTSANIVAFAQEIFLSFQYLAIRKHIDYSFESKEEFIEVYFDQVQLEKVFFNLLSNAFKFTPENGRIKMEMVSKDNGTVEIFVSDNGQGIPEESRDKIFTNFYQVREQKPVNSGTGIGLALAEKIGRLHHGRLYLLPQEELPSADLHTSFCLQLKQGKSHFKATDLVATQVNTENPVYYQQESETDPALYPAAADKTDEGTSVLIVEDNHEVRQFIVQSLKPFYEVLEAENGKEGLQIAIDRIPDIIVSDVMMPEMDGLELCRTLKTDLRTSHIPVILLTARSGNIHEVNGLKTGAEAYVTKPFSINSLQLNINNLLSLQANMRRKFSQQITLQPSNILIESTDEDFLKKIMAIIEANFNDNDFSVNTLASEVGMSTPILYKKIKALTGLTVNNFIKSVRLKRAAQLLLQDTYTVYEVAYMVGFSDSKYFSKEFSKQFGQTPSDYCLVE